MALVFKKKISVILYFLCLKFNCFDLFVLNFRNTGLNSVNFTVNRRPFLKILPPAITVREEILKTKISKWSHNSIFSPQNFLTNCSVKIQIIYTTNKV